MVYIDDCMFKPHQGFCHVTVSVLRTFLMLPLVGLYSVIVEFTGFDFLLFS